MLMPLLMTLTLVAQANNSDDNSDKVQSFAERLKASHEQKKPSALESEDETAEVTASHPARGFQVRMTQTVAGRR